MYFLAVTDTPFPLRWYCGVFVCASWLLATFGIRSILESHLLLLDASLQSYLEGDYSCRLTVRSHDSLLSRVLRQCNDIGELLRKERLFATEANALVQKIVQEMDVAVLAFDSQDKVSLVNRAAERLLALPQARLLGLSTQDPLLLNLRSGTAGNHSRRLKFSEHRFYVDGKPHSLWTASDLTVALRDEERSAWQKLIRVLTHEIKNSLTPMQTLSQHLIESLDEPGWTENVKKALPILARRAAGLVKFIGGYAQLARLPSPPLSPPSLPALL
ncbi:PAS domain-containing protein [Nostoc sp. NIES-2111]